MTGRAARPLMERLREHVSPEPMSGCHLWTGAVNGRAGYGIMTVPKAYYRSGVRSINGWMNRQRYVHILSYEHAHGRVPDGMELDHKCRVHLCCNPDHLEPVTHRVNIVRGVHARQGART